MGKKCCLNAQELMRGKRLGPQYCKHLIVCDNVAEARTTAIVGVNCVARQGPKSHGLRPARRGEARARETERAAVDVAGGVLVWPSWCGGGVKAFIKHGGQQRHGEHRATKVTIMGTHNTRTRPSTSNTTASSSPGGGGQTTRRAPLFFQAPPPLRNSSTTIIVSVSTRQASKSSSMCLWVCVLGLWN